MTMQVPLVDPTVGEDAMAAVEPQAVVPDPLDPNDRYSIINLIGGQFREMVLSLPPELDVMSEAELKHHCQPTTTDYSLRASLWRAYDQAVKYEKKSIQQTEIFGGITSVAYWYRAIKIPEKVAWMIRPQQAYAREMEAILSRGTQRLWELVDMDITDKTGEIDVKKARLFLEAYQEVANRVKGMAVQHMREERRSLSMKVTAKVGTSDAPRSIPKQSLTELRHRIAELEKGGGNAKSLPQGPQTGDVIDAYAVGAVTVSSGEGEREVVTVGVVRAPSDSPGE